MLQRAKKSFNKEDVTWKLVPPHTHQANSSERSIQIYKEYFKAGLSLFHSNFPVQEWDQLLHQAELTLNLLRASQNNPRLSAQAYLFGKFNYNKTSVVSPGTQVLAHDKPTVRRSWALNGTQGFTVGIAPNYYQCIKCYFPSAQSEQPVDTVTFMMHTIPIPQVSTIDFLKQAAEDIVSILQQPSSTTTLQIKAGNNVQNALLDIATILKRTYDLYLPPKIN